MSSFAECIMRFPLTKKGSSFHHEDVASNYSGSSPQDFNKPANTGKREMDNTFERTQVLVLLSLLHVYYYYY